MLKQTQKLAKNLFQNKVQYNFQSSKNFLKPAGVGINPYTQQMYDTWKQNPSLVDPEWNAYFLSNIENANLSQITLDKNMVLQQSELAMIAYMAVRRYLAKGHEYAKLDPLKLVETYGNRPEFGKKKLQAKNVLATLPITESQLDQPFTIENGEYLKEISFFLSEKSQWTLREIVEKLDKIYCGEIGWEYFHIENEQKRKWLQERIENFTLGQISKEDKLKALQRIVKNEALNSFFVSKFSTVKRFGIEGCDALISGLESTVDKAHELGIENINIGMPHRGRLNTLATVMHKPLEEIFSEFQDKKINKKSNEGWGGAGDVKYHLGVTSERKYDNGPNMNMRLLPNPSHLEAVNPCVYGSARAIQDFIGDNERQKVMGILIHGDSAFSGQGVVYESLQLGDLKGYTSGGIIHIVANNQIGFTTTPAEYRSGFHCTEIAKVVEAPIFHVNADHPEKVDFIMKLAVEYRQQFNSDVVVDIVGYRKFGHNELDQPAFTQPVWQRQIQMHPNVKEIYSKQCIEEGLITEEQIREMAADYTEQFEESYQTSRSDTFDPEQWRMKAWEQVRQAQQFGVIKNTNQTVQQLKKLGFALNQLPEDFHAHKQIEKIYQARAQSIETGKNIDMATAEALAFGSLLQEGFGIRLSGQDVERGTFSHRHSRLHDQKEFKVHTPFHNIMTQEQIQQNLFNSVNSSLSEYGVLGFEYGYSITNPNTLVMWEAQFGDFSNGAQIMIDNFIATGETKWGIQSGLVIMLPHGMDGQGAEHSSGRLERYLSLSDDNIELAAEKRSTKIRRQIRKANWQIVNCTTSVNYFHALRRQMRRDFRKPLVMFNSKKLLRFKRACSDLQDFQDQIRFTTVYGESFPEQLVPDEQIKKVVICSGQVYYDILAKREELNKNDIAIIRVEQLCPFPYDFLKEKLFNYSNAEFIWCQEEHRNHGAWEYVEPRIELILEQLHKEGRTNKRQWLFYEGRKYSASPAAGSPKIHQIELDNFLNSLYNY
ncbi:hypothetical protein PPERSA_06579 [Pseudocohnilembus persalinus]|uniref:2-oxoglutarate dehydrogenase, mitochondrial n=1 Tax=Pseudocohnilembus persalinus TaxID=266149 RepID=A0A0V0QRX3_PSEPJ|nr:hypothetical protein PPERSA_06579 [Pseudocohnilembus persalinus]|eukprot:KRX04945.1 hypothetical protein PPERSA_06579 [Pseudocohnilembus persalinus]